MTFQDCLFSGIQSVNQSKIVQTIFNNERNWLR